jgi:membrane-associated protein
MPNGANSLIFAFPFVSYPFSFCCMEFIKKFIDIVLHLDKHLTEITSQYGTWTYLILFGIIFLETGVVVLPFLPGDSLLFAVGSLAANPASGLNVWLLAVLLFVAAVLGDTLNYHIGKYLGNRAFSLNMRFIKKEYLLKTQAFYEKHGGKTIILARFIPIIRTFAPFVAGVGTMSYRQFLLYNVVGAFVWIGALLSAGYLFGTHPFVQKNFSSVIVAIIIISILPAIFEFLKAKLGKKA